MIREGHVEIVLPRSPDGDVAVSLNEPLDAVRLLSGRTPVEAARLVPALYTLCGTAQASASVAALEAATDTESGTVTSRLRDALVSMERLREHVLRIALDWPRHLSLEPDRHLARSAMSLLPDFRAAVDPDGQLFLPGGHAGDWNCGRALKVVERAETLVEGALFGEPATNWLDRHSARDLVDWCLSGPGIARRFVKALLKGELPDCTDEDLVFLSVLVDVDPEDLLSREDSPVPETSVLERRREHPMLTTEGLPGLSRRFLARLVDLALSLAEVRAALMGADGFSGSGRSVAGWGQAETARGRLMHRAVVRDGRVSDYLILSPTRWNFAGEGVAARCLRSMSGTSETERLTAANLVVSAVDPCVAHRVRVQ